MLDVFRYCGFGDESSYGTAVEADVHVDISSATLDSPTGTENYYAGGLGRGVRTRKAGYYAPSGNVVYAWDIRTVARLLRWALGGYTFTAGSGSGDLNKHEIYASNATLLPSFTTRIGKDAFEHVFAGCVAADLQLGLSDDFLLATMNTLAQKDAKAALKAEADLLLPDEFPLAFHEVTMALPAGEDISPIVRTLSLSIANGSAADRGRTIGSRFPRRIPAGAREIMISAELVYANTDQIERLWGDSGAPSNLGSDDFSCQIVADAGDDGSLTLDIASAHFTAAPAQPSGRDEITQACEIRCIMADHALADASTVSTELLATVENAADDLEGGSGS